MNKKIWRFDIIIPALSCIVLLPVLFSAPSCFSDEDVLDHLFVNEPLFLATANTGDAYYTSDDGKNWRFAGVFPVSFFMGGKQNIIYAEGKLHVVAASNTAYPQIQWSDDGVSWSSYTHSSGGQVGGTLYHNGTIFLTTWLSANPGIYRFGDDKTMTMIQSTPEDLYCLAYGDGIMIAAGENGSIYATSNGHSWSRVPDSEIPAGPPNFWDALYARDCFVLVGEVSGGPCITVSGSGTGGYSKNLVTASVTDSMIYCITYGNRRFVAPGWNNGGPGHVWYSDDGHTWQCVETGIMNVTDITYGNGLYVIVTEAGYIYHSEDGISWEQCFDTGGVGLLGIGRRP